MGRVRADARGRDPAPDLRHRRRPQSPGRDLSENVRVSRSCVIPEGEFRFRFARSGGPGGQNVNKRDTQVELIFDVANSPSLGPRQRDRILDRLRHRIDADGRLRVVVSDQRTQGRNREIAVERVCKLLADALKPDPPKRRATKPSRTAVDRRIKEKRIRGERKRTRSRPDDD